MNVEYFDTPVPYAIVRNFYNEQEVSEIWKELEFLTNSETLLPPAATGTATSDGIPKKKNNAIFLDNVYTNRNTSYILKHNRKIWDKTLIDTLFSKNIIFKYLPDCNQDGCLVSYYEDSDYYNWHHDTAIFTFLVHFYKEPKQFTGGEFILHPDKIIENESNRLIVFPSFHDHSVTEINMKSKENFSGYGRYTITQFVGIKI